MVVTILYWDCMSVESVHQKVYWTKENYWVILFVRKSLRTKQENTCETSREETRMKHLLEFDPRIESHKEFCQKHFESFLGKFKKINQGAVIFKSFVLKQMLLIRQKSVLWMQTFRRYVVTSYPSYKSKPILTDV